MSEEEHSKPPSDLAACGRYSVVASWVKMEIKTAKGMVGGLTTERCREHGTGKDPISAHLQFPNAGTAKEAPDVVKPGT